MREVLAVVDDGSLLLDRGTLSARPSRAFAKPNREGAGRELATVLPSGPVVGYFAVWVYRYPDGGAEVVVQSRAAAVAGFSWRSERPSEPPLLRSASRSRRMLTRFARFHGLDELWTLTYADVPADRSVIAEQLRQFWRRVERRVGERVGPYVVVEEYGGSTGRLHLHMGANWSRRFGAVEVCLGCARPALLAIRSDVPPATSLCVGCLWGHGFVGRPGGVVEVSGVPQVESSKGLSAYLSKYLAKDLDSGLAEAFGRQRYRVSHGFKPDAPLEFDCESAEQAIERAEELLGAPLEWWSSAPSIDGPLTLIGSV